MAVSAPVRSRRELLSSLGSWVARLMSEYPWFDEYDLSEMIEEKTGFLIADDDFDLVRGYYLRLKLRSWSPEPVEEED